MSKKSIVMVALIAAAGFATAADLQSVARKIPLQDGTTVYIFKDGKMSMEDKVGRVVPMKEGHVMLTTDGQRIVMVGNELARLEGLRAEAYGGGGASR